MLLEGILMMLLMTPVPQEVSVQAIELTQAIQDTANSVPLIANRRTIVRVYLDADADWTVEGWLHVRSKCGDTTIRSINVLTIDPAMNCKLALKRSTINGSLNFEIPACEGVTTLELDSVYRLAPTWRKLAMNKVSRSATFEPATTLPLCIVAIPYKLKDGTVLMPRPVDYRLLRSWLLRAFPISELSVRYGSADMIYEEGCKDIRLHAWENVASFARIDRKLRIDNRTHYYGIVFDDGYHFIAGLKLSNDETGSHPPVSFGPAGAPYDAYLWDTDGSYGDWYGAHEIGHQFYRHHIGCGLGNDWADKEYPYYGGFLSDSSHTYVGFDVGDTTNEPKIPMRPLRWDIHHDVMSYSIDLWPSDYTYRAILARLREEEKNGSLPMRPDIGNGVVSSGAPVNEGYLNGDSLNGIIIVGTLDTATGTGEISDVTHVTHVKSKELSSSVPGSRVTLRMLDAAETILREHGVEVNYVSSEREGGDCLNIASAFIDELLPDIDGIDHIELRLDNRVVDTWKVPPLPNQRDASAMISPTPTGVVVRWPSLPNSNNNLNYLVQESLDGGRTWFLLAIERGSPGIELDRASYKGLTSIVLRVIDDAGADSKEVARTTVSFE